MSAHVRRRNRDLVVRTALLSITAGVAPVAFGDAATWTGAAGDRYWQTANNWSTHVVPTYTTDVTFSTSIASGSVINIGNTADTYPDLLPANSLTLNTTTSFTLGNQYCYIGLNTGNLTRSATSSGTQTLNTAIDLQGTNAFTWNVGGTGSLVVVGQVLRDSSAYPSATFTKSGTGALVFKAAPNNLALNGYYDDLTWAGTLNANVGTIEFDGGTGDYHDTYVSVKPATVNVASATYITVKGAQPLGNVNIAGTGVFQGLLGYTGAIVVGTDAANSGTPSISTLTVSANSSVFVGTGAYLSVDSLTETAGYTFTKFGPGGMMLEHPAGNFTGAVLVSDGDLGLYDTNAVGGATSITVAPGASLSPSPVLAQPVTVAGTGSSLDGYLGAVRQYQGTSVMSGRVVLTAATSIGVDQNGLLTINGQIGDNGAGYAVTKVGPGRLVLGNGNNVVSANFTVAAGTLAVGQPSAVSNGYSVIVQNGATLEVVGGITFTRSSTLVGTGASGTGALYLTGGGYSGTATLTGDASIGVTQGYVGVASGPLIGSAYNLTKVGGGTLQLTGASSTFKSLTVATGTLLVSSDAGIPAAAPVTVATGADLELTAGASFSRSITVSGTGLTTLGAIRGVAGNSALSSNIYVPTAATLGVDLATSTLTATGNITGAAGVLTKVGPGKLVLLGSAYYQTLNVTQGAVAIAADNASSSNTIVVSPGATLEFPQAIEADGPLVVSGTGVNNAGAIHTTGAGSTYLPCPITMTGNTTIVTDAGTSPLNDVGISDNNGGFVLTKSGPGTLSLAGNDPVSGGIVVAQGTLEAYSDASVASPGAPVTIAGGAKLVIGGTGTYANRTFTSSGGSIGADAGVTATLTGCTLSGGYLRGPGTFVLGTGTSLFNVSPLPGSRISVTSPVALANFYSAATITVGAATTWDGGYNQGAGNVTVKSGGSLAVNSFENDGVISVLAGGSMTSDVSNLVTTGGSQILVGSKAAPGGTLALLNGTTLEVNGGLLANNGTINGTVNVNYGGLAKGSGVYGTVNVNDGGKFSPGNSPGAVTTGNTTWGSGGGYLVEVTDATGAPGVGYDLWNVSGNLNITAGNTTNSRFVVSLASLSTPTTSGPANNFNPATIYSWQITHVTGNINGFDPSLFGIDTSAFQNSLVGTTFSVNRVGAGIYLSNAPASLTIPAGSTTAQGKIVIPALTVSGKATLDAGSAGASEINVLSMPNDGAGHYAGSVDLVDSDLVLHATPEATVRDMIRAWYDNGARDGNGLGSSFAAQPGPDSLVTLGELTNSDGMGGALHPAFDGVSLSAADVIVKYTYLGDTDLNGVVDNNDLANFFAGLEGNLTGWVNGDFNYDGKIDAADAALLLNALRGQGAPLGAGPGDGGISGAVPEPSALLGFCPLVVLARRRTRRQSRREK